MVVMRAMASDACHPANPSVAREMRGILGIAASTASLARALTILGEKLWEGEERKKRRGKRRQGKRSANVNLQKRAHRSIRFVRAALHPKLQTLLQMHSHLFCVHADTSRDGLLPSSFRTEGSAPNLQSSSVSSAGRRGSRKRLLSNINTMEGEEERGQRGGGG